MSPRTANSYSGAITGAISTWAGELGLCAGNLADALSVDELLAIATGLEDYAIFREQNKRGKSINSSALKTCIEYRKRDAPGELEQDVTDIMSDKQIVETEKATYISARVGQGKYCSDLIDFWGRCALTGFADVRFLVASHIKPWRESSNPEEGVVKGCSLLPVGEGWDEGMLNQALILFLSPHPTPFMPFRVLPQGEGTFATPSGGRGDCCNAVT